MRWATAIRDSRPAAAAQDGLAMAYWRCCGRREGDVFLCSYPKCGRTWLRFLLTDYQLRLWQVDYPLTLKSFAALSPNLTLFSDFRLRRPSVEAPIHRILGSHAELPRLFRGLPIIVLRRDLRDVLVSYYYHRLARGEIRGDLESFLASPWGVRHAARYHNLWCRALARFPEGTMLSLTYERLHADTAACVRECLEFLGLEVREDLIGESMAYAAAENMRRLEGRWGTLDFSVDDLRRDENAFHVREARVGSHRRELSAATLAELSADLRGRLVDPCGYEY